MEDEKLQLIELSNVDGWVSGLEGVLFVPGDPVFNVYQPVESVETIAIGSRRMIRFGRTGVFGALLVDLGSENVVQQIQGNPEVSLVNTSISAFNSCLEVLLDRLPLDELEDEDEEDERSGRVAREIESALKEIDPQAYTDDSFWCEVRWSVATGDFTS
ncbi:SUKH-4 family immunity protein [Streptomyces chartreusis]|uniref:SUKH-4 family immunity protein n=1 Tax=Streptomyces chartreusis TaxID=1969 RepID=UPI003652B852